jgi:hypothetical protein
MLPEEIKPAMQGLVPSTLVSCSLDGEPNTTEISQVWYVDESHVALSHQFFNKTHRNIRANPFAFVIVRDFEALREWHLELQYERSETEGPLFDEMDMKLEAIASMTGMSDIFQLRAADIYKVLFVRKSNSHSGA